MKFNASDIKGFSYEGAANTAFTQEVAPATAGIRYYVLGISASPSAQVSSTVGVPVTVKDGATTVYKEYINASNDVDHDNAYPLPITKGNALSITAGAGGTGITIVVNVFYIENVV